MWRKALAWLLVGLVLLPTASAQDAPQTFKPEELDQLVAPIALHPDALVAQILMASTYPLEVVQAARFVQDKPGLTGDQLNDALKQYTWDDSVKSLVFFPQVLAMMNDKLDWLQKLGDAVLGQQQDVMAAVQRLRGRAQAAGQLQSTPEQQVIVEPAASPPTSPPPSPPAGTPPPAPPAGSAPPPAASTTVEVTQASPTVIRIEPTNPEVVYVPSYNPTVVYGAWPYPAYPPYYPYPVGAFAAGAFTFAAGAAVGAALWGDCNWHGGGGEININSSRVNNFTTNVNNRTEASKRVENYRASGGQGGQARQTGQAGQARQSGQGGQNRGQWQHNPEHRKGVQYRDTATQQRYNKTGPANAQSREAFRGHSQQATGAGTGAARTAQSGGTPQAGARERQGGQQPSASVGDRAAQSSPRSGGGGAHQGGGGAHQGGGGQARQAGAFEGMGSGHNTQSFSNRGNSSRQSYNASTAGANRSSGAGARSGAAGGRTGGGGGGRGGGRR
jgi:Protein of unknown function (DUF3300)